MFEISLYYYQPLNLGPKTNEILLLKIFIFINIHKFLYLFILTIFLKIHIINWNKYFENYTNKSMFQK